MIKMIEDSQAGWWFGCHQFYFPINIGFLSSSQLTKSYFSEGWRKTTNQQDMSKSPSFMYLINLEDPACLCDFFLGENHPWKTSEKKPFENIPWGKVSLQVFHEQLPEPGKLRHVFMMWSTNSKKSIDFVYPKASTFFVEEIRATVDSQK